MKITKKRVRKTVQRLFDFALLAICLFSVLGLGSHIYWMFVFLDQPRVHYCVILVIGLLILFFRRRWIMTLLVAFAFLLNMYLLSPAFYTPNGLSAGSTVSVSVLHANVGGRTRLTPPFHDYLEQKSIDVLFLQEVTPELLEYLATTLPNYTILQSEPRSDSRGVACLVSSDFSGRFVLDSTTIVHFDRDLTDRPSVVLRFSWNKVPVSLLSFHCKRPASKRAISIQRAEYRALADWFNERGQHAAAAIGDFNATPWSQQVRWVIKTARLPGAQDAFSLHPSWPSGTLLLLGIPIDLCLHNAHLRVSNTEIGPDVGSDHQPLYCELIIEAGDVAQSSHETDRSDARR